MIPPQAVEAAGRARYEENEACDELASLMIEANRNAHASSSASIEYHYAKEILNAGYRKVEV